MHFVSRRPPAGHQGVLGKPALANGDVSAFLPRRLAKTVKVDFEAPNLDPLELGIDPNAPKKKKIPDPRLPMALKRRRRLKRLKHRFDDAPEKPKRRKKKRRIIFLDSDSEEEDDVEQMEIQTNQNVARTTTTDPPIGIPEEAVTAQPSTLQVNTTTTESMAQTARVVTPISEDEVSTTTATENAEPPFTPPHCSVTACPSCGLRLCGLRLGLNVDRKSGGRPLTCVLQQLFKCQIAKPQTFRVPLDSQFADALHEVEQDGDDSVGSDIGAGTKMVLLGNGSRNVNQGSLWEWFSQRQPKTTLRETPTQQPNNKIRSFQNSDGSVSFAMLAEQWQLSSPPEDSGIKPTEKGAPDLQQHEPGKEQILELPQREAEPQHIHAAFEDADEVGEDEKQNSVKGVDATVNGSFCGNGMGPWSLDEDLMFLHGLEVLGFREWNLGELKLLKRGKWREITEYVPSRSTMQIKSRAQELCMRQNAGEDIFQLLNNNKDRLDDLVTQANLLMEEESSEEDDSDMEEDATASSEEIADADDLATDCEQEIGKLPRKEFSESDEDDEAGDEDEDDESNVEGDAESVSGSFCGNGVGEWSLDEDLMFLHGLKVLGRDRWRETVHFVPSRTKRQVQNHGPKLFLRQDDGENIFKLLEDNKERLEVLVAQASLRMGEQSSGEDKSPPSRNLANLLQIPQLADYRARLSDYDRLLLDNIEMFQATATEVDAGHGRISLNQLGLRCRHCALVKQNLPNSTSFPGRSDVMTRNFDHVAQHLIGNRPNYPPCPNVPECLRTSIRKAKPNSACQTKERGGSWIREYFSRLSSLCGVVNTRQGMQLKSCAENLGETKQFPQDGRRRREQSKGVQQSDIMAMETSEQNQREVTRHESTMGDEMEAEEDAPTKRSSLRLRQRQEAACITNRQDRGTEHSSDLMNDCHSKQEQEVLLLDDDGDDEDQKFKKAVRSKRVKAETPVQAKAPQQSNQENEAIDQKRSAINDDYFDLCESSDDEGAMDTSAAKKASKRRASIEIMDDESDDESEMVDKGVQDKKPVESIDLCGDDEEDLQQSEEPPEVVVIDSSDSQSEESGFAFKEDSPVGICERIFKDDMMMAEVMEFRTQSEAAGECPYSLSKFLNLWKMAETLELGVTAKEIEFSREFRSANGKVQKSDSQEQAKALYGRILPKAMQKIFEEIMNLQPDSIFVDLGHGIGNTCLQASYTIGCQSKGIELVDARYFASEAFHRCLAKVANKTRERRKRRNSGWHRKAGVVELRHGRLENPAYHDWLTGHVHHVFVNNFADVMGDRSAPKKSTITVDMRIAAMFANMHPGSVMVTLHPIDTLGLTRDTARGFRDMHGLKTPVTANASFFAMEEHDIGPANETVSWSADGGKKDSIRVYKYTRLEQPDELQGSVFLCTNHNCERARNAEPIPSTINGENGLVMNACDCKYTAIRTRGRNK